MADKTVHIEVKDPLPLAEALIAEMEQLPDGIIGAEGPERILGLEDPVRESGDYRLLKITSEGAMELFWHSAAHLMAQAVKRLYPDTKLGIGPSIRDGFYYDIDFGDTVSADILPDVEAEMHKIVEENLEIHRAVLSQQDALDFFKKTGQDYKIELIEELQEEISTYSQAEFTDLCRGPHLPSTGFIKHFKLLALTGAYWRGDERNPMLQRIYGTAYPTAKELKTHLHRLEEAKKRDHRLIGKQLGLFSFHNEAPGAPFWHNKGAILFNKVQDYLLDLLSKRGYTQVKTPLILSRELWERSGHWDHYKNNMYFTSQEERDFAVKPMNCPGHVMMYKDGQWSYRDLPQRWAEMGTVHRYEKSGTLHGLFRVRHITQDDAHIFCTPEQMVDEVAAMIRLVFEVYGHFGMTDMNVELSTRPKDRIGSDEMWDKAEAALKSGLDQESIKYEAQPGEGAFYGPKIDFHVTDSLHRTWQCSTIQLDFNFPERFDMEYIGADNQPHRPVMLHRAILGSVERFLGILIEHYGGDFPLWLAPEQARVLPITDNELDAAASVQQALQGAGFLCSIDSRAEKVGKKIREAELSKIPYMLIVGAREAEDKTVSVRRRGEGDGGVVTTEELIARMKAELPDQVV